MKISMHRRTLAAAIVLLPTLPAVAVAQEVDQALFDQGAGLYEELCVVCHRDDGAGDPPEFPALNRNAILEDPAKIVGNIYLGEANMPPFSNLDVGEFAALVNYVRNAWANSYGGVPTEDIAAYLEAYDDVGPAQSIWDGIYTTAQAERGRKAYSGACGLCHGERLNGAPDDPDMRSTPPLARSKFLREWDGNSVAAVFAYSRAKMPQSNPGFLTDQEYIDIVAYMLSKSDAPTGSTELPPDQSALASILIEQEP